MARIYLETSFVSACVTDRTDSNSLLRRDISVAWWESERPHHAVYLSAEVVRELASPGFRRRDDALALVRGVDELEVSAEVIGLAATLIREKAMPGPLGGDAVHVACSVVHRIDYVLTWNIRHLANLRKEAHLRNLCLKFGMIPPRIVTPEQFVGDDA